MLPIINGLLNLKDCLSSSHLYTQSQSKKHLQGWKVLCLQARVGVVALDAISLLAHLSGNDTIYYTARAGQVVFAAIAIGPEYILRTDKEQITHADLMKSFPIPISMILAHIGEAVGETSGLTLNSTRARVVAEVITLSLSHPNRISLLENARLH